MPSSVGTVHLQKVCALVSKECVVTGRVKSLIFKLNYKSLNLKFSSVQESEIKCGVARTLGDTGACTGCI